MKKLINWLKSPSSDFALLIIFIVLLNIVSFNAFARIDLTGNKSYSLSKVSKQTVKNLQEPLSVKIFFDGNLPSPYNNVAQYVEDLLSEYKSSANSNFTVNKMDMRKQENLEMAADLGLSQIQIQEIKNNEVGFKQVYMGVVVTYGDSVQVLDSITSSDGFEYKFTSLITKMISTADILASLKKNEKINITLYFSDVLKQMGIVGADEVEKMAQKAFDESNKQNKNRLEYNVVNPDSNSVAELTEKYGLQSIQYKDTDGSVKMAACGMVVEYGDKFRVIPLNVERSLFGYMISGMDSLTESISQSLQSIVSNVQKIGYINGHLEASLYDEKQSGNFSKLVSPHYTLEELRLTTDDIPSNMNCIIINGPRVDFEEEELYKIDQFIMRGGNVLFFVDALFEEQASNPYTMSLPTYKKNELNIEKLLNKYGIKRNFDVVFDNQCFENANAQYGKLKFYWAPVLQKPQLEQKSVITKNLGYIVFYQNASFDVTEAKNNPDVKVTSLAKTSSEAWTESENFVLNPMLIAVPEKSQLKTYDLAVLLEGKFNSAYTSKPVFESENSENTDSSSSLKNDSITTDAHLTKGRMPGKIFFTGSSYPTSYQLVDGSEGSTNALYLLNILDYMNGNEELCTMRTKGLSINVLNVKSQVFAAIVKYFNMVGLTVLVVIAGLIVWRARVKRRKAIREKYNPNDERQVK